MTTLQCKKELPHAIMRWKYKNECCPFVCNIRSLLTVWCLCTDVVSLLCLQNAKEGGHSSWSSSITVYNEILRQRPDLAHLLAGPWFFDRKGEVPEGKQGFFEIPVFNFHVCLAPLHAPLPKFCIAL